MACEIHFGDVLLRDDRGIGWDALQTEPLWQVGEEDAFRSSKAYVRGNGNAAIGVKFRLTSIHATYFERLDYRTTIYQTLLETNLVSPRELWVVDPTVSIFPYSFGPSFCNPPRVVEEGRSEDGFTLVMEYDFTCDVIMTLP